MSIPAGRKAAFETATRMLGGFQPLLIVNRLSGGSRVNILQLKRLLKEYVGGDLVMLGEVPDDPAMTRSVRAFLPVVESEPAAASSAALRHAADALLDHLRHFEKIPAGHGILPTV